MWLVIGYLVGSWKRREHTQRHRTRTGVSEATVLLPCLKWVCNYMRYYSFLAHFWASPCDLVGAHAPTILLAPSLPHHFNFHAPTNINSFLSLVLLPDQYSHSHHYQVSEGDEVCTFYILRICNRIPSKETSFLLSIMFMSNVI